MSSCHDRELRTRAAADDAVNARLVAALALGVTAAAAGCGAPAAPAMTVRTATAPTTATAVAMAMAAAPTRHTRTSVERFVAIAEQGGQLYGLGTGCDEWRATPEAVHLDLAAANLEDDDDEADDDGGDGARREGDDAAIADARGDERGEGDGGDSAAARKVRLKTTQADAAGLIHTVGLTLLWEEERLRVKISRGSHPAPGVVITSIGPDGETWALLGTARMCSVVVEVRQHPELEDAILVDQEPWYLSRQACLRANRSKLAELRGCSETGKATP